MNISSQLTAINDDGTLSRQGTMSARVFDALKTAIVQLQLRPGNSLSEAEVAKQLGVSRQPVREAFIKLAEVGLVEIRPQRGTFVVLISRREVENARFIREAIEVAVVRKAAVEILDGSLDELLSIIEEQKAASAAGDHALFLRLDEAFHQALSRSVDCEHAWRVIENLKAQMDRVRYLSLPNATPLNSLIAQHEAIVAAIADKDADAADKAMREHLSEILNSLPKIASSNPRMFAQG